MNVTRESIFSSALRIFFSSLTAVLGIAVALVLITLSFFSLSSPVTVADKTSMIVAPDANGNRELLSDSAPVVLRINIHGVIGSKDLSSKTLEAQLLDSQVAPLKDRVKAIFLHMNTPGGGADDANNMYTSLLEYKEKYKVPIYMFIDGLCASGGIYISAAADKIYSSPVGIIGSVGVIMGPAFNFADLMQQYGVKTLTLTRGKDKDMLSPFRPWKPNEDAPLQDLIDYDYHRFVDVVTQARPRLDKDKLINDYGAHVFAPPKAAELGYIDDGNSSYSKALADLVKQAGIEGSYQVIELKVLHPVLSELIEGKAPILSGKLRHEISLPGDFPSELLSRPLYLYLPGLHMHQ